MDLLTTDVEVKVDNLLDFLSIADYLELYPLIKVKKLILEPTFNFRKSVTQL